MVCFVKRENICYSLKVYNQCRLLYNKTAILKQTLYFQDEITAATSLGFSLDGRKLYAGYEKTIRVFDTEYGVRPCRTMKTFGVLCVSMID